MTLGAMVDVVIGLMLCYLWLGLIGSALLEALAGWFNFRGRGLRSALQELLGEGLFAQVYGHGLVAPPGHRRPPAYVAPADFSAALLDTLGHPGTAAETEAAKASLKTALDRLPAGAARQSLQALLATSKDLDAFRDAIEHWFDHAMNRTSGRYKRLSNNAMLAFGLLVAIGANIDSLALAHSMWVDAQNAHGSAAPSLQALPIGWDAAATHAWSVERFIGWVITALAVSVGAPFWFDTLQKFLRVRSAGPKPGGESAG
jgi:hypothetical protein